MALWESALVGFTLAAAGILLFAWGNFNYLGLLLTAG